MVVEFSRRPLFVLLGFAAVATGIAYSQRARRFFALGASGMRGQGIKAEPVRKSSYNDIDVPPAP